MRIPTGCGLFSIQRSVGKAPLKYYSACVESFYSVFPQVPASFDGMAWRRALCGQRSKSKLSLYNDSMVKLSIKDLGLKDTTVFMRVDFNVPLGEGGKITSDKRIRASLPTIQYALEHGAGVVLASHLGRPKGKRDPQLSLAPVAERLSQLLGRPVAMAPDCVGPETAALKPKPGEVLLLENLRFHPEEEANDPEFSRQLAALANVYVNDAFGSAHRAHASTVGIVSYLPIAAAGLLMDKEIEWLTRVTRNPERPCVALLGGAKVSDKIAVIHNLVTVVDKLLIGGAMAYTFLRAKNQETGRSLVEEDKINLARELLGSAGSKLMLPVDHVVVREVKPGSTARGSYQYRARSNRGRYRAADHAGICQGNRRSKNHHLEWADGNFRDAAV